MSQYLLPCPQCQTQLSVGIAQAGSTVRCTSCGEIADVPGTRQLRLLPTATLPARTGKHARNASEGYPLGFRLALASLLLVASLSLVYGGWLVFERWLAPIEFGHTEEEFYGGLYQESMSDPIARTWEHWNFLVEMGVPEESEPLAYFQVVRYYEQRAPWMFGSLATGAIAIAAFLGLSFYGSRSHANSRVRPRGTT